VEIASCSCQISALCGLSRGDCLARLLSFENHASGTLFNAGGSTHQQTTSLHTVSKQTTKLRNGRRDWTSKYIQPGLTYGACAAPRHRTEIVVAFVPTSVPRSSAICMGAVDPVPSWRARPADMCQAQEFEASQIGSKHWTGRSKFAASRHARSTATTRKLLAPQTNAR
jgi:hypothetical protein